MNNKLTAALSLITIFALFFGIKLNNYITGKEILGDYTPVTSVVLTIKPVKSNIRPISAEPQLTSSLAGIRFNIPKTDTINTFKLRDVYRSFYFRDKSKLKVFKDSVKTDYLKILTSLNKTGDDVIGDHLRQNKITTNFDLLLLAFKKTPADISFFNLSKRNTIIQYTFLKLKDLCSMSGVEDGLHYFTLKNVKGFEFGNPAVSRSVILHIFVNETDEYTLVMTGLSQRKIDYIIQSIQSF